jgi:hypothetical protein
MSEISYRGPTNIRRHRGRRGSLTPELSYSVQTANNKTSERLKSGWQVRVYNPSKTKIITYYITIQSVAHKRAPITKVNRLML